MIYDANHKQKKTTKKNIEILFIITMDSVRIGAHPVPCVLYLFGQQVLLVILFPPLPCSPLVLNVFSLFLVLLHSSLGCVYSTKAVFL